MKWLYKLEYKYGRFCIPNLMFIIAVGQGMVYLANMFVPAADIMNKLVLYWPLVAQGQIWRLITFVFVPLQSANVLLLALSLYFYYFLGKTLENTWGSFKFNVYYLLGMLGAILASAILGPYGIVTTTYLNLSLFFAFAMLYPDMQVLLFFIVPVKIKYMALASAGLTLFSLVFGTWGDRASIVMALINFLIFFGGNFVKLVQQEIQYGKTRRSWRNSNQGNNQNGGGPRGW